MRGLRDGIIPDKHMQKVIQNIERVLSKSGGYF